MKITRNLVFKVANVITTIYIIFELFSSVFFKTPMAPVAAVAAAITCINSTIERLEK